MYNLENGTLKLEEKNLEVLRELIKEGKSPKEALNFDLKRNGLDIRKVRDIDLPLNQLKNKELLKTYSEIVTDFWNQR